MYGGARKRCGEAEARGVLEDLGVMWAIVELFDVPLEGAVPKAIWRFAFGADGGAPHLV